jgi:hypothetical protein
MSEYGFVVFHQNPIGHRTQIGPTVYNDFIEAFLMSLDLMTQARGYGDQGSVYGIHVIELYQWKQISLDLLLKN